MARTLAELPKGSRITDYISLGVVAKTFPLAMVKEALAMTGKGSVRQRDLPAHVVVYYVIALAFYMQCSYREVLRCLLEGIQWLLNPTVRIKIAGKSGISQARTRLGVEPLRRLHDEVVRPIALEGTRGAWYRGWHVVSLDGSTLDVADERDNEEAFGRPGAGRGKSAYPQIRFVSLVESGTHLLFGSQMGGYSTGEISLAKGVLSWLHHGMLCLADRQFFGFVFWNQARATGAQLLWRIRKNSRLACERRLADGSYLSRIYPSERDRRHKTNGEVVRVIDYCLEGVAGAEAIYRLITTILDPELAPAHELAALYHERWEIGVSREVRVIQLVKVRPRLKDSRPCSLEGTVAREQDGEALRRHSLKGGCATFQVVTCSERRRSLVTRIPVAETVDNERRQQEITGTSRMRYLSPAGYQRRHGTKDYAETGEALGARRGNLDEEGPAYNREWEVAGMAPG